MTQPNAMPLARTATQVTRAEVEDFLYQEAALLDEWRLDEWQALFEEGGEYLVPVADERDGDPSKVQHFIADDWALIGRRVRRLKSRLAHAENPRSRTHRMIANVRITAATDDVLDVQASFIVHRIRDGNVDPYVGTYRHRLVATTAGLRFRLRRAVLDFERLSPASRISFIL